jgi:nitrate/TMAO reductase-like tetraheme cytochrome c subunit
MSGSKMVLMLIAVVAIGIFALPSTMSMFGGQHTWYDIASDGVPCVKCHADTYEEFSRSEVHSSFARRDARNDVCYVCHRADPDLTYAKGGGSSATPAAHAASTIACMACHEFDAHVQDNNQGPFAGGFEQPSGSPFSYGGVGSPPQGSVISDGNHTRHNACVQGAVDSALMEDSNEACIACHTAIPVEIDWDLGYAMHSQSVADSLGDWTVGPDSSRQQALIP